LRAPGLASLEGTGESAGGKESGKDSAGEIHFMCWGSSDIKDRGEVFCFEGKSVIWSEGNWCKEMLWMFV